MREMLKEQMLKCLKRINVLHRNSPF